MIVKITSKRQVTFPKLVMERFALKEGERLQLSETPEGILIQPHRFNPEKFAPLRNRIPDDLPAPDFEAIRHAALEPRLRS